MLEHPTYTQLLKSSQAGKTVFRIWYESGESPLIENRLPGRAGFFSPNPFSAGKTSSVFKSICGYMSFEPNEEEADGTWVRDTILEHVRGNGEWLFKDDRRKRTGGIPPHLASSSNMIPLEPDRPGSDAFSLSNRTAQVPRTQEIKPNTDSGKADSPWIVTHANLNWVIHRIVKLLSRDYGARIHMAVIALEECTAEKYARSAKHLKLLKFNTQWGAAERKILNEAYNFAERSEEVLFYGRIFAGSVEDNYTWSHDHLPFSLPSWFWRAHPLRPLQPWLDCLLWTAHATPYTLASKWIAEKTDRDERRRKPTEIHDFCDRINA